MGGGGNQHSVLKGAVTILKIFCAGFSHCQCSVVIQIRCRLLKPFWVKDLVSELGLQLSFRLGLVLELGLGTVLGAVLKLRNWLV